MNSITTMMFCPICRAQMRQSTGGWYCPSCRTATRIFSGIIDTHKEEWKKLSQRLVKEAMQEKQEEPHMKVSYNGFTGELVKLEKYADVYSGGVYKLEIYDEEKKVKYSFIDANIKELKFLGGSVSFE